MIRESKIRKRWITITEENFKLDKESIISQVTEELNEWLPWFLQS